MFATAAFDNIFYGFIYFNLLFRNFTDFLEISYIWIMLKELIMISSTISLVPFAKPPFMSRLRRHIIMAPFLRTKLCGGIPEGFDIFYWMEKYIVYINWRVDAGIDNFFAGKMLQALPVYSINLLVS